MDWYLGVLKTKYADFSGRAQRQEYWMFMLFNSLAYVAMWIITFISGGLGFALIIFYALAIIVPTLALSVRRLHDTNRSGWWLLINFFPIIGGLVYLIFMIMDGTPGLNEYGEDPKGRNFTGGSSKMTTDNVDALEKLHALLEKGVITQEEFNQKKSELL